MRVLLRGRCVAIIILFRSDTALAKVVITLKALCSIAILSKGSSDCFVPRLGVVIYP